MKINPRQAKLQKKPQDVAGYLAGLEEGNRFTLSEVITLVESHHNDKRALGLNILSHYRPINHSFRIGISGSPGVGKSTFLDYLGSYLISIGKKVAILAIDPASFLHKGSILGDKTRMEKLSRSTQVYIRPTSASSTLGGTAHATKETIMLCEMAGFDTILVETVGVGQSEIAVNNMVDLFTMMVQPGAGDDLQGIKRGITEMADLMVIHKADGPMMSAAKTSKKQYADSLKYLRRKIAGWEPKVHLISSLKQNGIKTFWKDVELFFDHIRKDDFLNKNRLKQDKEWLKSFFNSKVIEYILKKDVIGADIKDILEAVNNGSIGANIAAHQLHQKL